MSFRGFSLKIKADPTQKYTFHSRMSFVLIYCHYKSVLLISEQKKKLLKVHETTFFHFHEEVVIEE
jgi:hypothetical protein